VERTIKRGLRNIVSKNNILDGIKFERPRLLDRFTVRSFVPHFWMLDQSQAPF
jgi:hypothetical protein